MFHQYDYFYFLQKEYEETMHEDRRKVAQQIYDKYLKDDVSSFHPSIHIQ